MKRILILSLLSSLAAYAMISTGDCLSPSRIAMGDIPNGGGCIETRDGFFEVVDNYREFLGDLAMGEPRNGVGDVDWIGITDHKQDIEKQKDCSPTEIPTPLEVAGAGAQSTPRSVLPASTPNPTPSQRSIALDPLGNGSNLPAEQGVQKHGSLKGSLGRVPSKGNGVVAGEQLNFMDQVESIAKQAAKKQTEERGLDLLNAAVSYKKQMENANREDGKMLNGFYEGLSVDQLQARLRQSQQFNEDFVADLKNAKVNLDYDDLSRFMMAARTAAQKAEAAQALIAETDQKKELGRLNIFDNIMDKVSNPDEAMRDLASLFSPGDGLSPESASSWESLADRYLKFGGLNDEEQKQAYARLNFAEGLDVLIPGKGKLRIVALHNGYVFGNGQSGVDCSGLVSELIGSGRATTQDLRSMWDLLRTGQVPRPPIYQAKRLKWLKRVADNFVAINPYRGEYLQPGDLLFTRFRNHTSGHVVIVKSVDRPKLQATIIESSQSAGTVRERKLDLSLTPADRAQRYIRPGLWALRFRDGNFQKGSCQLKTASR